MALPQGTALWLAPAGEREIRDNSNGKTMNRILILAAVIGPALVTGMFASESAVQAADDSKVRLRGTIDSVAADTVELTLRDNTSASVSVPANARVTWLLVAQPSDIKPGSYIGTVAIMQSDGTLKAIEVQVFPPNMRGGGEGTHPWDMGAKSSMTNGTVGTLVD